MKPTAKRLSKKEWREIRKLLKKPNVNISAIARKYKINRVNIYQHAWRRGIFEKKEKPKKITLKHRIKAFLKPPTP